MVPVIDEARALAPLLADLAAQRDIDLQTIVVDGGSSDDSQAVVKKAGVEWLVSPPGRARQMNAGAAQATGDWLCFIHADSRLRHPQQLKRAVDALTMDAPRFVAGHFALRFLRSDAAHEFFYRFLEAKTATGRRYTINGDQGVVIHRDFFDGLGGFDERMGFLEDQRLARTVERAGGWRLLPDRLDTSARRFETEGEAARYLLMALIMAMYIVDVPAFFTRARNIYPRQSAAARLQLMPYFRLLRTMARECGLRASLRIAWATAGVAMSQLWQPCLAIDLLLEKPFGGRRYCTGLYERWLRPLVEQRLTQALLLGLLLAVLFGPVQLVFALRERRDATT